MKILSLLFALITAPTAAFALPVVGEQVVYVGQALMADGLYDIKKTIRVEAYDSVKREYTVLQIFEQSAEGAPLGSLHETTQVPEAYYAAIENQLIPTLATRCGESFPSHVPTIMTTTAKESVETPMGTIEACRMNFPAKGGMLTSSWFAAATAPWAVKGHDQSLNGTYMTIILQSHTRP